MLTPSQFLKKISTVNVSESSQMAIIDTDKELAHIQQDQLFQGFRSDGEAIEPEYAPSTVARKKKKGQPYNRVTLKDLGDVYAGIIIDVREETFVITSADWKVEKLENRYTKKIFGLNEESRIRYVYILKPAFLKRINEWKKVAV